MFLTLLSLPYFVSLPLAFVVGAGLTVGFFLLVRLVWRGPTTDETKDVAGSIAFRVGAIHALVLGLAFATVLGEYDQAGAVVDTEAIAIVELESLLRTINDPQSDKVRKLLITYTEGVLSKGWQQMAEGKAFPVLSVLLDNIVIETYRLPAENPASLVAQKVALQILEFRVGRLFSASQRLPVIFWILGGGGVLSDPATVRISEVHEIEPHAYRLLRRRRVPLPLRHRRHRQSVRRHEPD